MDWILIKSKFHIRDLKSVYNMKISENKLTQACFSVACSDGNSIIGNKTAYFRNQFNISVEHDILVEGASIIKSSTQVCEEMQLIIDHILSLILTRSNNYLIEGFDLTEINDMISHLTTN